MFLYGMCQHLEAKTIKNLVVFVREIRRIYIYCSRSATPIKKIYTLKFQKLLQTTIQDICVKHCARILELEKTLYSVSKKAFSSKRYSSR